MSGRNVKKYQKKRTKRRARIRVRTGRKNVPIKLQKHTFIRRYDPYEISLGTNSTFVVDDTLQNVNVADTIEWSELKALFDKYKIDHLKVKFTWMLNNASNNNNDYNPSMAQFGGPELLLHKNRDGESAPADLEEFNSKSSVQKIRLKPFESYTMSYKPNVLTEIYKTTLASAYGPKYDQFLRTEDDSVPYYGLDVGVSKMNAYQGTITVDVSACITLKGVE